MGSSDILFALATGTTWLRKPQTIRVVFRGRLPEVCSGRDVILELLRHFGEGGAQYQSLEFHDHSEPGLPQDDRFAIANMAVEAGAKFGLFVPDAITHAYLQARDGQDPASWVLPDDDAPCRDVLELDLTRLNPRVAKPWSPANVVGIEEVAETPITMAFLGSCSSGRLSDIQVAAEELRGRSVHPDVRMVVIPASQEVFLQALKAGHVQTLTEAGAVFNQSSCGPCGGIDKGVLAADDVCVSTSNRNFRGRMGDWHSQTFLASARTVARAAVRGAIGKGLYP
jgi:3-isopropylmalate/(R)-2-methylmalate dehydratase large subunit